jgi:hypothetical protein
MENKYFKVYEDLVVREIIDLNINNDKNIFGIITYSQSSKTFRPNFFKSYKKGKEIFLCDYKLKSEIFFTKYFKLDEITETPDDDQKRNYYKRLVFTLVDNFGDKCSFDTDVNNRKFYREPESKITFTDLQEYFFDILKQIKQFKSFEAFHLSNIVQEQKKTLERLLP